MARGINKVILVGNVGQDPDRRATSGGNAVTIVSMATSETWKDKQTGQQQERTEWHRVVFFGRIAEVAAEYLRKGSQAYVEGTLRTRKWQAQDGTDRYTTEIVVDSIHGTLQLLGGKPDQAQQRGPREPAPRPTTHHQNPPPSDAGGYDDFDDDIPFMRLHPLCGA